MSELLSFAQYEIGINIRWCRGYVNCSELKQSLEVTKVLCCSYAPGFRGCKKCYVWYSIACWQNLWLSCCLGIVVQETDKVFTPVSTDRFDLQHYIDRSYSVQRILKFLPHILESNSCHSTERVDLWELWGISALALTLRGPAFFVCLRKEEIFKEL